MKRFSLSILSTILVLGSLGCANTARKLTAPEKQLIFNFSVEGIIANNNPNVTYYIVFNIPNGSNTSTSVTASGSPTPETSPSASGSPNPEASPSVPIVPCPEISPTPSGSPTPEVSPSASGSTNPETSPSASGSPNPEASPSASIAPCPEASLSASGSPSPETSPSASGSPSSETAVLDPGTDGPRMNGPDINFDSSALQGRLPFLGLLPGNQPSAWTHFYYFKGSNNGKGDVGFGRQLPGNIPIIENLNYPPNFWSLKDGGKQFEIRIPFSNLELDEKNLPPNFTANIGVSGNIDRGQGFVYDTWQFNVPFSIETKNRTSTEVFRDDSPLEPFRQISTGIQPPLPSTVIKTSINITSYTYQIR